MPGLKGGRALALAVGAAAFLAALKGAAAWWTGSLALFSASLDSVVDLFVSSANYVVLRRSRNPPDSDHAYGHGKFEDLAALGQALMLGAGAVVVVVASVRRFGSGGAPRDTILGILVLAAAMVIGVGVGRLLSRAGHASESPVLNADAAHYLSDAWINGGALGALLLVRFTGFSLADPLVALLVAAVILRTAGVLGLEALSTLSDRTLPDDEVRRIGAVLDSFKPRVRGFHDLRTRRAGSQRFIEIHVEIPRSSSFEEAHDLTVEIINALRAEFPKCRVFVHPDPV